MKRSLLLLMLFSAHVASAYEFTLQFTPAGGALGLNVAGYQFDPNTSTVTGNCSYYTLHYTGGRGGHTVRTNHYSACAWDVYGNLLSVTPTPSPVPAPAQIAVNGTQIVYAQLGTSTTGRDSRGFGFVNTLASHYTWSTPNNTYTVIPDAKFTLSASLVSDGDFPLAVDSASVTPSTSGIVTASAGRARVLSTSCGQSVPTGVSCTVNVVYDPSTIACSASPYGFGYTTITLSLVTDAGKTTDFTEGFTVTGIPICDD